MDRYHRQTLLPQIGRSGQDRLSASRVLVIGCGALGTVLVEQLTRAGVGHLCIVDRDIVELTNLQRQVLFDEEDARRGTPKAVAAVERLKRVNSTVKLEPIVADVHSDNAEKFAGCVAGAKPVDLIIDGTDNAETRYLINDVAVKHSLPWVYGACIGTEGRVMSIQSPITPCLRCVFPTPPAPGELPTCDTVGVLGSASATVASLQAAAAIRLLVSDTAQVVVSDLVTLDVWTNRFKALPMMGAKRADCPCCARHQFVFLDRVDAGAASLCGRNAVQIRPPREYRTFDLPAVAARLAGVAPVEKSPYFVRWSPPDSRELNLTLFADGRLIVAGTNDLIQARAIYSKYVGA